MAAPAPAAPGPPAPGSARERLRFFPVTWGAGDEDGRYLVTAWGRRTDGCSVRVGVEFSPYFYVELPRHWGRAEAEAWVERASTLCRAESGRVERLTSLWTYQAQGAGAFARLTFRSLAGLRGARKALEREHAGFKQFEARVNPLTRFMHGRDLRPASWLEVWPWSWAESGLEADGGMREPDLDVRCAYASVRAAPDPPSTPPPLVFASWDIECHSPSGGFPDASKPGDCIIQIATTFQVYGAPAPRLRTLVALGPIDAVEGVEVVVAAHERDLLTRWMALLRRESPDLMVAYNSTRFDWPYVVARAEAVGADLGELGTARSWTTSSAAFGKNEVFSVDTPGCAQFDLMLHLSKTVKADSYSLNAMAAKYLGDAKVDMSAGAMFEHYASGDPGRRALVGRYCVKDTELPLRLMARLNVFASLSEMANAVRCPLDVIIDKGQQAKVYALILEHARARGFVCPDGAAWPASGKYEGATVLHAARGAYFSPVVTLDFASLYPSIMRCAAAARSARGTEHSATRSSTRALSS